MPAVPSPSPALLGRLVRRAMSRGLQAQDAEDVVLRSYYKAAEAYDRDRGSFEHLFGAVVDNECRFWWRTWQRSERRHLRLVVDPALEERPETPAAERAAAQQQRLLDALTEEERRVFALWALQRHLPRGRLGAADAAARLGVTTAEWENAKRRLRTKIAQLLDDWKLSPRDFFSLEDDERPRRSTR